MKLWQTIATTAIVSASLVSPIVYITCKSDPAAELSKAAAAAEAEAARVIDVPPVTDKEGNRSVLVHRVSVGELVRLQSEGEYVAWDVVPFTVDLVSFGDKNSSAIMSFRQQGRYDVIAAVHQDGKVEIRHVIVAVGPQDVPANNPTAMTGWDAKVASWLGGDATPARKAEARSLAQSFAAVAQSVEVKLQARELVTADAIITQTAAANKTALAFAVSDWSGFRVQLTAEMKALSDAGKLTTMQQHVETWRQIAAALERFAQ